MSRISCVRSITRRSVAVSMFRCWTGERLLSKIIRGALCAVASARISSSLPRPTKVAGSAASRNWNTVPATSAPALRASSTSSDKDSRPCSPAGIPGKRGARFHPRPTSKARSAVEMGCCVFVTGAGWESRYGRALSSRNASETELYTPPAGPATSFEALRFEKPKNGGLQVWVIAETGKPCDGGLFAKPRELTLGIASCGLLDGLAGLLERQFVSQNGAQFAVAEEIKRFCVFVQACFEQTLDFPHPSLIEHGSRSRMDSLIKLFARGH